MPLLSPCCLVIAKTLQHLNFNLYSSISKKVAPCQGLCQGQGQESLFRKKVAPCQSGSSRSSTRPQHFLETSLTLLTSPPFLRSSLRFSSRLANPISTSRLTALLWEDLDHFGVSFNQATGWHKVGEPGIRDPR